MLKCYRVGEDFALTGRYQNDERKLHKLTHTTRDENQVQTHGQGKLGLEEHRTQFSGEDEMNEFQGTLLMLALFVLRFSIPLIATLIFGYGMNRLLDRQQLGA
jgi:hypothetical protein